MALKELRGSTQTARGHRRAARRRVARRLSTLILVVLLAGGVAGLAYIWWSGSRTHIVETEPVAPVKTAPTPPAAATNTPVGVAITTFSSPIKAGANASVTVRTKQKAACSIVVTYDKEKSNDSGLVPKTADEYGSVGWSWTVEANRPAGTWPVDITCARDGKSGYARGDLVVRK